MCHIWVGRSCSSFSPDQDWLNRSNTKRKFERICNKRCWVTAFHSVLSCQCLLESWDEVALFQTKVTLNGLGSHVVYIHFAAAAIPLKWQNWHTLTRLHINTYHAYSIYDLGCSLLHTHGCMHELFREAVSYSKSLVSSTPYPPNRIPHYPPGQQVNLNRPKQNSKESSRNPFM